LRKLREQLQINVSEDRSVLEEQGVYVPTRTRRIRSKFNVPRERFRKTSDGLYRTVDVP